jgi:hypothetical protein
MLAREIQLNIGSPCHRKPTASYLISKHLPQMDGKVRVVPVGKYPLHKPIENHDKLTRAG